MGLIHHFLVERGFCFGDNTFLLIHISHTTPTLSAFPQRTSAAAFSGQVYRVRGLERDRKLNEACFMLGIASCWWQIHLVCKENKMGKDIVRKVQKVRNKCMAVRAIPLLQGVSRRL